MEEKNNNNNSNNQKLPRSARAILEAQRKAAERFERLTRPSQHIAEMLKQQQKVAQRIAKLTEPPRYLTKAFEQIRQQEQRYADITNTLKQTLLPDYTSGIKTMIDQLKLTYPRTDVLKQFSQAFDTSNIFKSVIEQQRKTQRRILEALKPSFQIQKSLAAEIARMNDWQHSFKSLTASLQDFRPAVEVLKDGLVIESERFSQAQITQIAGEYIWDRTSTTNVFQQPDGKKFWELVPKPVRWLICLIIATIFAIYFSAIWKELTKDSALSSERVARRLAHFRKQEVRQISKRQITEINPPFVSTECLHVHINPKRKSKIIAVLSYPCEVKILAYKKKKRWIFIEWEDTLGQIQHGWTLGRYIYRKNQPE